MFPNTLDKKPIITKSDGIKIRDLTQSIFDFDANNFVTYTAYKVPKEYVMRPDLISQAVYNNTMYTELILKYNGISNPFTIEEDDVILIPGLDSARDNLKKRTDSNMMNTENQIRKTYKYIDPTKQPIKDPLINDFDNRDLENRLIGTDGTDGGNLLGGETTLSDGALPPNISEDGTSQINIRNGRVFFGEGIGLSACLRNGMSNSDFLTKVIKSRQTIEDPILDTPKPTPKRT